MSPSTSLTITPHEAQTTYQYSDHARNWAPLAPGSTFGNETESKAHADGALTRLVVASYNVGRRAELVEELLGKNGQADVILLQQVDDKFLEALALHPIGDLYRFSSHVPHSGPSDAVPERLFASGHMVVMSRRPFSWRPIHVDSVQNITSDIICLAIELLDTPLVLVGWHMASHSRKSDEFAVSAMLDHLRSRYDDLRPCVLVGDIYPFHTYSHGGHDTQDGPGSLTSRFETMLAREGFFDAWLAARCRVGESSSIRNVAPIPLAQLDAQEEDEEGSTFVSHEKDPSGRLKRRRKRRDRIYVRPRGRVRLGGFNIFGPRSDGMDECGAGFHYGIRCLLEIGDWCEPCDDMSTIGAKLITKLRQSMGETGPVPVDSILLRNIINDVGGWPSRQEKEYRNTALRLVDETLRFALPDTGSGAATHSHVVVIPTGPFGLGTWTGRSDIDCLCIGPYSFTTFHSLVLQRLKKTQAAGVRLLRRVRAPSGTLLELDVQGIKVNVQYCAAAAVAESWPDAMKRPPVDEIFSSLSNQTLAALKPARDIYYMLRSIPDLAQFRTAHLFLQSWARSRGIFSARFGYIGSHSICVMLAIVSKALALGREHTADFDVPITSSHVILAFFNHYLNFDWRADTLLDLCFHHQRAPCHTRAPDQAMCIVGWHGPSQNAAPASTISSLKTVMEELSRAQTLLCENGLQLKSLLCPVSDGATEFLTRFSSYIRIDTSYWGSSSERGRMFLRWVESRCASLLIEINRGLPSLMTRIWPTRFVGIESAESAVFQGDDRGDSDGENHQSCSHLIGLDWDIGSTAPGEDKILEILDRFQRRVAQDHRYFDDRVCFVGATIVSCSEASSLKSTLVLAADEGLCDYELDPGQDEAGPREGEEQASDASIADMDRCYCENESPDATHEVGESTTFQPGSKLRSAADVLNRIRWDGSMDTQDYAIGYEDRFLGVLEKPLSSWSSEKSDEEFIPQHRIVYFRRLTDGSIVWDRRTRKDTVFRS